jgi:hypothetical protein
MVFYLKSLNPYIFIANTSIAGSFPHTFSQCVKDMSISGSTAKNSFIRVGSPDRHFSHLEMKEFFAVLPEMLMSFTH